MKPVSLGLQAFGSYAGELHIDFARLARHGIFSISGPTGAGKSTIFDALVYALYDDLPGFRVDGNVRSQFADVHTPTWVSLDFVVHGERWRVRRSPAQLAPRAGGRGSEARERKSEVVLGRVGEDGELEQGTVVTRKSDVKRRIDALVGLAKDQFEQVVLIPQGRFEEVLKADTQQRAPLLRRLFPVEVFTGVTESLKAIASARGRELEDAQRAYGAVVARLEDAYDAAVSQLPDEVRATLLLGRRGDGDDAVLGGVDGGDGFDGGAGGRRGLEMELLGREVDALTASVRHVDALVGALALQADTARARLGEGRRAADEWDRWQEDLAVSASFGVEEARDASEHVALDRARRLADLRGVLEEWQEATRQLGALEPELAGLAAAIGSEWPDELGASAWTGARGDAYEAGLLAERLAADARRLEAEIGRFERLQETLRSLGLARTSVDQRRVELAERGLKLDAEDDAIELVTEEVQMLRAAASGRDAHAAALSALEREHQMATSRAAMVAEVGQLEAAVAHAAEVAARSVARADAVRASWRDGVAGRLAKLLVDDEPCPTCGALEHPAPAEWLGEGVGDGELEAAERAREDADRSRSDAEQRVAAVRGGIDALCESRPLDAVEADLAARREALYVVREAEDRLVVLHAEERRRRAAIVEARDRLVEDLRALESDAALVDADTSALERAVEEFVAQHGRLESPAPGAAARAALAEDMARLAGLLREVEGARSALEHSVKVLEPVARELDAGDPGELLACVLDPVELDGRTASLEERRARREDVRRRIAEYEARAGAGGGGGVGSVEAGMEVGGVAAGVVVGGLGAGSVGAGSVGAGMEVGGVAAGVVVGGLGAGSVGAGMEVGGVAAGSVGAGVEVGGVGAGSVGAGMEVGGVAAGVVVGGLGMRPDVEALEAVADAAASEHVALVQRRGVLADRVAVLAGGPAEVSVAAAAVDAARVALEQAKTLADRCAGLGGGPGFVRLSLENWVLADYLRQVLVQANQRLEAMTDGRFALELSDGVTDGRKAWGLDLAVFDANTGQVRPATTLSGGETFMAALALALGLADVVSGGSNREVGALFVDEGFGSLDAQSLDAVVDVLRSLEDGGRTVGVISHVRELQQALPSGITVEPSAGGSLARVHYPPE